MKKEFTPIKDFTSTDFSRFRPKSHLDFIATGMHRHGLIIGTKMSIDGRFNTGQKRNNARIEFSGSQLKEARRLAGVTQSQLASTLGITGAYISLIENEERRGTTPRIHAALLSFMAEYGIIPKIENKENQHLIF